MYNANFSTSFVKLFRMYANFEHFMINKKKLPKLNEYDIDKKKTHTDCSCCVVV